MDSAALLLWVGFFVSQVLLVAAVFRLAVRAESPGELKISTPIAFAVTPSLFVLCLFSLIAIERPGVLLPDLLPPTWSLAGIPIVGCYLACGLVCARSGWSGLLGGQGTRGGVYWIVAALVAPAVGALDQISPIDALFLVLALVATSALSGDELSKTSRGGIRSVVLGGMALWLVLIACSFGSAVCVAHIWAVPAHRTMVLAVLLVSHTVMLILPSAVAAERGEPQPSTLALCGASYLKVLVAGCVLLVLREVLLELIGFAIQLKEALEAGLAPSLFPSQDLKVSGFALSAPELFFAIPFAAVALIAPRGGRADARSGRLLRLCGVGIAVLALVAFSWRVVGSVPLG